MATVIERKLTTVPDSPDKSLGDSKSGSSASCRHHLTIQGMGISWPFLQGICSSLAPLHWLPVGILDSSTVSEARCDRSTQSQAAQAMQEGQPKMAGVGSQRQLGSYILENVTKTREGAGQCSPRHGLAIKSWDLKNLLLDVLLCPRWKMESRLT